MVTRDTRKVSLDNMDAETTKSTFPKLCKHAFQKASSFFYGPSSQCRPVVQPKSELLGNHFSVPCLSRSFIGSAPLPNVF
jgi:hypothetical protein